MPATSCSAEDVLWCKFPDGDRILSVSANLYMELESTGYAWNHLWQKGSLKSLSERNGFFSSKRQCAGVLRCQCGYVQRPYVAKPKITPGLNKSGKQYREKLYRQYCRGACFESGREEVPLEQIECDCILFYRAKNGRLDIEHRGTHQHERAVVTRATKSERKQYLIEAENLIRVTPKKKLKLKIQLILGILMLIRSGSVSG